MKRIATIGIKQYHCNTYLNSKEINNLSKKIDNIVTIGDGEIDIYPESENDPLYKILNNLRVNNQTEINQSKILVVINMHGITTEESTHVLETSHNTSIASADIFDYLNETINKPMDIIFIPCHGKGALKDINLLQ